MSDFCYLNIYFRTVFFLRLAKAVVHTWKQISQCALSSVCRCHLYFWCQTQKCKYSICIQMFYIYQTKNARNEATLVWSVKHSDVTAEKELWKHTIHTISIDCVLYNVSQYDRMQVHQSPYCNFRRDDLMQPSIGILNSPTSRFVKDSTSSSRHRILRSTIFRIGES